MNWKCLLRSLPAVAGLWFTLWVAAAAQAQNVIAEADPMDWPYWRGPEMNGISREKNLPETWSPEGENLLWKREDLAGRSTPIVMKGKLYMLCRNHPGTTEEGEKVVCVDAATGETVWENAFNVYLSDVPDTRVGWSSVVGDPSTGHVYALGVCGLFQAIDGETGKTLWSHSLSEQYGILTTYGGRTNFPIVYEDLVIISGVMTGWGELAVPAHRFLAFDKRNGVPVWLTSTRLRPEDTTYSSPVLTVFNGEPALVVGAGDGSIYAFQPRTGKVIWKYDASIRGINTTPLVVGTTVYCGHSEEIVSNPTKVGAVFALDGADKGKELWAVEELGVGKSAPLCVDDRLYVIADNATIFVLDTKNKGAELGKKKLGTTMTGSAVYGDGKIYAGEASGRWWVLKPSDNGVDVVQQQRLGGDNDILGSPIISHGRIYLPTGAGLYCIGNKDQQPSADPRPEAPTESPVSEDEKPAWLQIAPCEMLMKPGEKVRLQARLYNAKGQYLKQADDVQWSVDGTGSVDEHGYFHAPKGDKPEVALITGKSGQISGSGRIRISPPLPWSFDFNDGKIPPTWIGVRGRFQPREVDGEKVLVKVTTVPKGTRSQSWMGQDDLHDYTIQADVRGALTEGKLPDIGLIDQRYTLDLMGEYQQLQIRSWTPQLEGRFAKNVPFKWKPDTWYTLKFQSENKDGEAVLRGKVWPRDEKEPEEWQIEAADKTPNTIGSPGLFGNAQNSEIYLDNIRVYSNSQEKEPSGSQ